MKIARDPADGKALRDPATGKLWTTADDGSTPCCCAAAASHVCEECESTPICSCCVKTPASWTVALSGNTPCPTYPNVNGTFVLTRWLAVSNCAWMYETSSLIVVLFILCDGGVQRTWLTVRDKTTPPSGGSFFCGVVVTPNLPVVDICCINYTFTNYIDTVGAACGVESGCGGISDFNSTARIASGGTATAVPC